MEFTNASATACFLVDNGSLRPAATLALRQLAVAVSARVGFTVEPVSLLHSNRIPAAELGGKPAEIFEPAIHERWAEGVRRFLILPLFFGPSGAITEYIPQRVQLLAAQFPRLAVRIATPVAGANSEQPDPRLAQILVEHVRDVIAARQLTKATIVLVDHGSPQRAVGVVRDRLAGQLADLLHPELAHVIAASMERREGAQFDFNEPLLERALSSPPCGANARDVVIAPLFFFPGRHAGPAGDIATIAERVAARYPEMRLHFTRLVGEHPRLIEILADRYAEAQSLM